MTEQTKSNYNNSSLNSQATPTQPVEENFVRVSLINQGVFVRKKKTCPLAVIPITEITYKNIKLLSKFLSERGKIIPSRITNVAAKKQRALSNAIKRARHLALISPSAQPTSAR